MTVNNPTGQNSGNIEQEGSGINLMLIIIIATRPAHSGDSDHLTRLQEERRQIRGRISKERRPVQDDAIRFNESC